MSKPTNTILNLLYPKIEKSLKTNTQAFKKCFGEFLNERHQSLFATAPLDRIYYGNKDIDMFFDSLKISIAEVRECLSHTYYWNISAFNPRYAKDELTIAALCAVRYYMLKKDSQMLDIACVYLSFSGKFYPSIHYMSFPTVEPNKYPHIMEYVVNNLTNKYILKTEGTIIGTIKSIAKTWIKTYEKDIKYFDDEDVVYIIQQLHNRIKSFMKNIASLYYSAYENRDYITYNSDNTSEDDFHLADTDSMKAERSIEKTMERINTFTVDYRYCKMAADTNVNTEEIKGIIESILNNRNNLYEVKEIIRLLIYTYFAAYNSKDVTDIGFITFSITPKPNTKDKHLLRIKEIVETWLEDNSIRYRKRKSRLATKNSYIRSVIMYFTLIIHVANK